MRQQRQRSGLRRDVAHDQLHQTRLELEAGEPRRLRHDALELLGRHRAEQHLLARHRVRQARMRAESPVDVGAQPDHDGTAPAQQRIDEHGAPRRVVARREQLLELVDDEQPRVVVVRVERRVGAGRDQHGVRDPGHRAAADGGDDAGAQERGLPAPGGADDGQEPAGGQAPQDVVDDELAAEEEPLVVRLEGEQAAVRAGRRRWRRLDPGPGDREDVLGRAGRQPVRAEVDERAARTEMARHELGRDRGEEDLAAFRLRAHLRPDRHRRPDVARVAALHLAGVDAPADGEAQVRGPRLRRERALRRHDGLDRPGGRVEDRHGGAVVAQSS